MSSILIDNGNLVTAQLAPGAKLHYLQDGTITGSTTCTTRLADAGAGLPIGQAHPFNSNAKVSESEVTYEEADASIFSLYIGVWSSAVQKVTTVAGVAAQAIEQSPVWTGDGVTTSDGDLYKYAVFDPTTAAFLGFPPYTSATAPSGAPAGLITGPPTTVADYAGNPDPYRLPGVTGFLQGTTTIRISYSATDSGTVTGALAKMGAVLSSLTAGQISYSYDYYAFICTSVTYEETPFGTGSAQWSVTEEYLLHNDGVGWDPAIYVYT
jgi:hypothetical protein